MTALDGIRDSLRTGWCSKEIALAEVICLSACYNRHAFKLACHTLEVLSKYTASAMIAVIERNNYYKET